MSQSWDLEVLRAHIRTLGPEQQHLLDVVRSIDRYVDIFRYHMLLARDALKGIVPDDDPHGIKAMSFVFGQSERQPEYYRAMIASEANILGSIQSCRALFDVFAWLINGLVLRESLSERKCNIHSVEKALRPSALKSELGELLASAWFKYVSAFFNAAKHLWLAPHVFTVSFETSQAGIHIDSFTFRNVTYPAYSAEEVLRGVIEVKNRVVSSGVALNQLVLAGGG